MIQASAATRTVEIRTISACEIGDDAAAFYERNASEPLIVRGLFGPAHPIASLDLDRIADMLGDARIHVYGSTVPGYQEVAAADVLAGMRGGHAVGHNVVDFYIAGTPLGNLVHVPPFLRQNWFLGAPANRDELEKSLVLSPAGSVTSLHLDAYGMQGWMYLIAGSKTWRFYRPDSALVAFDPVFKQFYDPRLHSLDQFPLLAQVDCYEGTVRGGELLYFPAGWIHQVVTTELSFGVGGSVLNDYQIEDHMRWWLWERTLHLEGTLDLKKVIERMPRARMSGPAGYARAQSAIALCDRWETRMSELAGQR
ncbi:MAG TPA: cupin-like domain-containing protein [Bryobacteraceae bacterium]|jgi:hypothetical protein|nr:cupin-like domain-containing protein [Bryobacteraceae bacterium]